MTRVLAFAVLLLAAFSARAEAACTVSATAVSFGTYNVFTTTATTSTGTITYRCGNADHNIRIDISTGSSVTFTPRTLKRTTEALSYNLYIDSAFANVWGDGSGTTSEYIKSNPPNGTDVILTVYGQVPAQQDVTAGSYSDTVVATINF